MPTSTSHFITSGGWLPPVTSGKKIFTSANQFVQQHHAYIHFTFHHIWWLTSNSNLWERPSSPRTKNKWFSNTMPKPDKNHHVGWLTSTSDFFEGHFNQKKKLFSYTIPTSTSYTSHLVVDFHQRLLRRPSSPRTKNKRLSNAMPTSTSHHHVRWLTYTSDFLERPIHLEPKSIFQQTMPTYTAHFITSGG